MLPRGSEPSVEIGYSVPFCANSATVDGVLDDQCWEQAPRESDFRFPWENRSAPVTVFQAFQTEEEFFFAFQAVDEDLVLLGEGTSESEVADGDRVELFLSVDPELQRYYCLEIDPQGRVLDYSASSYRKFDLSWKLESLRVGARSVANGYVVEAGVSLDELRRLGVLQAGGGMLAGLFRAEFSSGESKVEESWISWMHPGTSQPDFHVPSAFGLIGGLLSDSRGRR